MTRLLLVSYHFPPSSSVGGQRAGRLARFLPRHGFTVDVVAASLDRAVGDLDPSQEPVEPQGGSVRRVPTPFTFARHPYELPPRDRPIRRAWWKVRAYAEWLLLSRHWSWGWGKRVARFVGDELARGEYDVVVGSGPPFEALVPILRKTSEAGVPFVADLRDAWVLSLEDSGNRSVFSPGGRRWLRSNALERRFALGADHLVFTTEEASEHYLRIYPELDRGSISVVTNAYQEVDDLPDPPGEGGPDRVEDPLPSAVAPFRIAYTGSLAYGRDKLIPGVIRGLEEFSRSCGREVELVLAGTLPDGVGAIPVREGMAASVRAMGWVDRDEALRIQRSADVLLLLQPKGGFSVATPAKVFEYMARRRPILALVPEGPAARLIRDHGLGEVVTDGQPRQVSAALSRIRARLDAGEPLPTPPEAFSEEATVARFAGVVRRVVGAAD